MTRAQAPNSPQALATIRHDGWTPERQIAFLTALAAGQSVAGAAQQVGMSRQSAYGLRARLKGEPFDRAWHVAARCRFDVLVDAALERALHGVEVPHFHQGELIHTSRRYDERLTVALLHLRDRFGPRAVSHSHPAGQYTPEDFAALLERIAEGPETWDEEIAAEYAALYAGEDSGGEQDEEGEESDDGDVGALKWP